jgi:predicted permease
MQRRLAVLIEGVHDSRKQYRKPFMIDLLLALWPLFALIIAGYVFRSKGFPNEAFWPGAERLNYFILFPALLFTNLASAPLDNPVLGRLAVAVFAGLAVAWIGLLIARRVLNWRAARFGAITQGILRFNTYLGLAATGSLYGPEGLTVAALMLALMVPAVNVLSVWSLSSERDVTVSALLLPIAKNPLILACAAGALINVAGIGLPGGSDRLLALLAASSLPLGLLCVGAALRPDELGHEVRTMTWNSMIRLFLMPVAAGLIAWALHLPPIEFSVFVLFFALPTAPTSYVLTRQLNGDSQLMAGIITLQTLLAAGSLLIVMAVLQRL